MVTPPLVEQKVPTATPPLVEQKVPPKVNPPMVTPPLVEQKAPPKVNPPMATPPLVDQKVPPKLVQPKIPTEGPTPDPVRVDIPAPTTSPDVIGGNITPPMITPPLQEMKVPQKVEVPVSGSISKSATTPKPSATLTPVKEGESVPFPVTNGSNPKPIAAPRSNTSQGSIPPVKSTNSQTTAAQPCYQVSPTNKRTQAEIDRYGEEDIPPCNPNQRVTPPVNK
jgi:hypothetical protein